MVQPRPPSLSIIGRVDAVLGQGRGCYVVEGGMELARLSGWHGRIAKLVSMLWGRMER